MKTKIQLVLVSAMLLLTLAGCSTAPVMEETTEPIPVVEEITMVVTEESIRELEQAYPGLKRADLTGSTCYAAIEMYMARNPQVDVRYTVSLGGREIASDCEALTLEPEDYDYLTLRANLKYLPRLKSLHLLNSALLPAYLTELRNANPKLDVTYSVNFCGIDCALDMTQLDLSGVEPEMVLEQAQRLTLLPQLKEIQLMTSEGTTRFTLEQAAQLQQAVPEALLLFRFKLFEKNVSTTDEEVSYANQYIGNKDGAEDTLRMALSVMRGCRRFVLDNCHFTNETLAQLRDEFRDTTKVVWRVWFGKDGGCLTDRKMIYYINDLYTKNSANLIYCEDAEFIDCGHNEYLGSCEFVSKMKNLRAIILSGSMVQDLTPFANCESLEFLELAFCGYVEDISPLQYCQNLKRLNIAYTKVEDLSPLDQMELEVFVDARSKTTAEERARFDALHPDCLIQHTGDVKDDQPYGYPWRYEKNGDKNAYYAMIAEQFHYPHPTNTRY